MNRRPWYYARSNGVGPATLGLAIAQKRGTKSARVTLAHKLAVIMHRMCVDGTDFRWEDASPVAVYPPLKEEVNG